MTLRYKNITLGKVFEGSEQPRRTKVVCTIGPACDNVDKLVELIDAGLNVARLNFSHGDHESKLQTIENIRMACKERPGQFVSILLDTKGPEIRTGFLEDSNGVMLKKGEHVEIVTDYDFKGNSSTIACSYEKLPESVKIGDNILAADGSLVMKVVEVLETSVIVEMMNTGKLGERKNMNLPGNKVNLPTITDKDKEDIGAFGKYVDYIAVSFVQHGSDIDLVKDALGSEGSHVKTIAKIENQEGIRNFDDILETFDGIMVARGDMGMEIPIQKVFLAQKMIIRKCNLVGKPVVTATQMLESMTQNPRPTRAETTDVANAVLDGTDCVMLSGETASGAYPVEAVTTMSVICQEAESVIEHETLYHNLTNSIRNELPAVDDASEKSLRSMQPSKSNQFGWPVESSMASATVKMQIDNNSRLIIVMSDNPDSVKKVAMFRPGSIVLLVTSNERAARQLSGLWSSIYALLKDTELDMDAMMAEGIEHARNNKWITDGDSVVCLTKKKVPGEDITYSIELQTV